MTNEGKELSSIDFKNLIGGPLVATVEAQAQAAISTVNFIREVGFKKPTQNQNDDPEDLPTTGDPIYTIFKYPKEVAPYVSGTSHEISINVTNGGTGYKNPEVIIKGNGKGVVTRVNFASEGVIGSVDVIDQGKGYTKKPTAEIKDKDTTGGSGAKLSVEFTEPRDPTPARYQDMKLEVPMLSIVPIPYLKVSEVSIEFNAKINSMQKHEHDSSFSANAEAAASVSSGWFVKASASFKCSTAYQSKSKSTGEVERTYSMAVKVTAVQDELPGGMEKVLGILEDAIKANPASAPDPIPE